MTTTRSGEMVSPQIGKMGSITNLKDNDFSLPDGQSFNIKNDGQAVMLQVTLAGMEADEYIETLFEVGWNPEIIKSVKANSQTGINLKWGY